MSWEDRPYRDSAGYGGSFLRRLGERPVTRALLVIHVVGTLALLLAPPSARAYATVAPQSPAWSILLHPLAVTNPFAFLFLACGLWSLGGWVEAAVGSRRAVVLYAAGNLLGGAACFLLARLAPSLAILPLAFPVGGMFAWVWSGWRSAGAERVMFFFWPVSLSRLLLSLAAIACLLAVLEAGLGALGWLSAAAVGCAVGASGGEKLLPMNLRWPAWLRGRRRLKLRRPPDSNIDDILAQISRGGIHSLTKKQRRRLDRVTRAKQQESSPN